MLPVRGIFVEYTGSRKVPLASHVPITAGIFSIESPVIPCSKLSHKSGAAWVFVPKLLPEIVIILLFVGVPVREETTGIPGWVVSVVADTALVCADAFPDAS